MLFNQSLFPHRFLPLIFTSAAPSLNQLVEYLLDCCNKATMTLGTREIEIGKARKPQQSKGRDDGLTPEQRRERDGKALQDKAAKKAGQAAAAAAGDAAEKSSTKK